MVRQRGLWKLLPRRGAAAGAPRPPGVRSFGRERPRPARPRSQGRWGLRSDNREGRRTKALPEVGGGRGGRTEKGRAAMLAMLFIVLLARVTRKENKEPQSKGCNTREGRRYFCPPVSTGVSPLSESRCARQRETSPPSVEGRASVPEFRAPNTSVRVSPGGERVAVASSLISAGLILFPMQRQCLSPFDNLHLLLFFTNILCFPPRPLKRLAGVSGKAFRLSPQSLSGIYFQ